MLTRGVRHLGGLMRLRPPGTFPPFRARGLASPTLPELTKDRYPHVKRGEFAKLDQNHLRFFRGLLGEERVLSDPADCEVYNVDWNRNVRGYSECVLRPKTTEEVSKILSFCNINKLAVTPQGGNTGLVGGSVPVFDEIVLSLNLMNNIISIDDTSGILVCEGGCVLEHLDDQLSSHGLMMPLDLGAKGSCQIGGNVSTNAGGLRLLRYGNLQGNVLGIEAVLANGQVMDCLSALKKDNTGFHLKHLFVGSEGALGVVTKVAIQCPAKPRAVNLAFLGVESFDSILTTFRKAKHELGEILSSFEMIDEQSIKAVIDNLKVKSPISDFPFYILFETQGSNPAHDNEKVTNFLEKIMGDGTVLDGTVTNEPSKMRKIWDLRERIAEGLLSDGYVFKYDITLPLEKFYTIVEVMREKLGQEVVRCCGYGHIGDGNIHFTVTTNEFSQTVLKKIEPFVYEYTSQLKGSVSAEHGIGFRKPNYIHYSKSNEAISLMKDLKKMMDPNGILNPYKVLPWP